MYEISVIIPNKHIVYSTNSPHLEYVEWGVVSKGERCVLQFVEYPNFDAPKQGLFDLLLLKDIYFISRFQNEQLIIDHSHHTYPDTYKHM